MKILRGPNQFEGGPVPGPPKVNPIFGMGGGPPVVFPVGAKITGPGLPHTPQPKIINDPIGTGAPARISDPWSAFGTPPAGKPVTQPTGPATPAEAAGVNDASHAFGPEAGPGLAPIEGISPKDIKTDAKEAEIAYKASKQGELAGGKGKVRGQ